jgi:hypothetical protein
MKSPFAAARDGPVDHVENFRFLFVDSSRERVLTGALERNGYAEEE